MTEEWQEIPGVDYSASEGGVIVSRKRGGFKPMSPIGNRDGYLYVNLCMGGVKFRKAVHRLVAAAFFGPPPTPNHEVNHKDGMRQNNAASNLEWATRSEQQRHRFDVLKHGARPLRGEMAGGAKLTEAEVREIRVRRAARETLASLGRAYGVSGQQIRRIAKGEQWKCLP